MSDNKQNTMCVRFFIAQIPGATLCQCGVSDKWNEKCPVYQKKGSLGWAFDYSEYNNPVTGEKSVTFSPFTLANGIVDREYKDAIRRETPQRIREIRNACPYNCAQRTK